MYVTMALEYERKCTLLCMLDQTRKTPLLSQHHDEGTPICIAALENYPYLAYLQKKIWLRHPYPTPPSYRNFWSGEGTLPRPLPILPSCASRAISGGFALFPLLR